MGLPAEKTERVRGRKGQAIRAEVLRRDGYLCVPCKAAGRISPAVEVDHITPLEAGGDNRYDNLQAICKSCHVEKTISESNGQAVSSIPFYLARHEQRPIVTITGPAFSGKYDKAAELYQATDTIVDIDRITRHNYGTPWHSKLPEWQRRDVLRNRNRQLKTFLDGDSFRRCINVTPAPSFKERQFWKSLGELIVMPYDPDSCIRRAERDLVGKDSLPCVLEDISKWQ